MVTNDVGKLILLTIGLLSGVIMVLFQRSPELGAGIVIAVLGYLTGNGVLAVRREPPSPVLVPKLHPSDESYVRVSDLAKAKAVAIADDVASKAVAARDALPPASP